MEKVTIPGLSPYYGPTAGFSRAFQNFMKDIGDCRSKYEEDRIIRKEIRSLKESLEKPNIQAKKMKENLLRLVYFEMLGHDASFGFIHAVNYTQKEKLFDKRIGYLTCCLLLHKDHELTLLLMNTIQKDLKSSNIMENCIALIAVTRLVNKEMIPALLPHVIKLMDHKSDIVRKKAVMAAMWFNQLDPTSISSTKSKFQKTLCDGSAAVMGATLNAYLELVEESPSNYYQLTMAFVNIFKQIIEFRLPAEFTYYNVPAPWIQIKLLRILAHLGHENQKTSETMYEVLKQCLESIYISNKIGCAVLSECLCTAVTIHPNKILTDMAAKKVGLLLVSKDNNLKYIGIKILAHLIEVDVSYAFRHQVTVIDCLNDPDDTLKRKTLVLLYRMANASNVIVICEKMIDYLRSSVDEYLRADLVNRITIIAEKFAPDNEWFIETMNTIFEIGGDLVRPQYAQNLMRLIGEGTDDEDLDNELRLHAVISYLDLIDKEALPDVLIQLISWVIGEYSYLATHCDPEDVMEKLCSLLKRRVSDESTLPWVVSAVTKIVAQVGYLPDGISHKIEEQIRASASLEVKQRCAELLCLFDAIQSLDEILPVDASCEDLEVDPTLSFLDEFVADALSKGAAPYIPKQYREKEQEKQASNETKTLNMKPYPKYEFPKEPVIFKEMPVRVEESRPIGSNLPIGGMVLPRSLDKPSMASRHKPAKTVWDLSGYIGTKKRSGSIEQFSDSSSTTSGAESGTLSSGNPAKNYNASNLQETHSKEAAHSTSKDKEKTRLAEQLFVTGNQNEGVRMDKAGFASRRKQGRKKSKTSNQDVEQSPKHNQSSSLLLDFDDSGMGENSGPEHINNDKDDDNIDEQSGAFFDHESNEKSVDNQSSESLLEGLIVDNTADAIFDSEHENMVAKNQAPTDLMSGLENLKLPSAEEGLMRNEVQNDESLMDTSLALGDAPSLVEGLLDSSNPCTDPTLNQTVQRSVPELPRDFEQYKNEGIHVICEDTNIKLSIQKVYTPSDLTIVFYLINQSAGILRDVFLNLQPPSNTISIFDESNDATKFLEHIDGFQLKRFLLSMKFTSPSLHMILGGCLSYKDACLTEKRLFVSAPLVTSDFVRPLALDTPIYGEMWKSMSYEKKHLIGMNNSPNIADVCQIIEDAFNFHIVQIIGNEAISSGTIGKSNYQCLLHFKCLSTAIEFRLKTSSTLLNDSIIHTIIKRFQLP